MIGIDSKPKDAYTRTHVSQYPTGKKETHLPVATWRKTASDVALASIGHAAQRVYIISFSGSAL
jgi:hypothetical protein